MITLLIIIGVAICIYNATHADHKSSKQKMEQESAIENLPDIYLRAHQMTSGQKALNLWPSDRDLLEIFQYTRAGKVVYLKMKDGRSISCPLSDLDVYFDKSKSLYRIVVTYKQMKFSFYSYDFVFTSNEYNTIYNTLLLAGKTHNAAIMGQTYKNIAAAGKILKVISKM